MFIATATSAKRLEWRDVLVVLEVNQSVARRGNAISAEQRRVAIATNRREEAETPAFVRRHRVIRPAWLDWGRGLMEEVESISPQRSFVARRDLTSATQHR